MAAQLIRQNIKQTRREKWQQTNQNEIHIFLKNSLKLLNFFKKIRKGVMRHITETDRDIEMFEISYLSY